LGDHRARDRRHERHHQQRQDTEARGEHNKHERDGKRDAGILDQVTAATGEVTLATAALGRYPAALRSPVVRAHSGVTGPEVRVPAR